MNNNTNTNKVNAPQGTRRPVTNNQTDAEQRHNAMINNQVEEFEIDDDEEEYFEPEESINNNNVEVDTMMNNYTHTISFEREESFRAVMEEVIVPLFNQQMTDENVFAPDYKTLMINVNALDETLQTILTIALCSRRKDTENYGQIVINKNLPAVSNNHIFRKVMDSKSVKAFHEQYVELEALQGHFIALEITKNGVKKVEAIIFDITPEKKDKLQTMFKTSMVMKKTAKNITKATNTVNTIVDSFRKDIATEVAGSVATIGVNVAFTVADVAKSAGKAAYKQVAKYAYENRFSNFYDDEMKNATSLIKQAWNERKLMKGNKDDEEFFF